MGPPGRRGDVRSLAFIRRPAILLAVVLCALVGAHPTSAAPSPPSAVATVQIGPLPMDDGFSLSITDQDCGSPASLLLLSYQEPGPRGSGAILSHTYAVPTAGCAILASGRGARLTARVHGVLDLAVALGHFGAPLRRPGLPVGCGPPVGPEQAGTATGRIHVAIHPGIFGRLALDRAHAQLFRGAPQTCPAVQGVGGREFTAQVDGDVFEADLPVRGAAGLIVEDFRGDMPAPGMPGTLELRLSGRRAYAPTGAGGSARIVTGSPFSTGSLAFSALAPCPGAQAVNGTLAGALTIEDPLLGPVTIDGADATLAYTGSGTEVPGTCNGPGSSPVTAAIISTCGSAGSGCSVSAGQGSATLYDESDPGTQTITAESLDFGDGSPPVSMSPGGAVSHVYAAAGTYTATLSVTDATGATSVASTVVDIDP